jgi:hypothetical protein
LFVGLVWQGEKDEFDIRNHIELSKYKANIRVLYMHHTDSTGPCLARHLAHSLRREVEEYYLQIDSHMRFLQGWDACLLKAYSYCKVHLGCDKPVITSYPSGYELPSVLPDDRRPTLLYPSHFDDDGILRQKARLFDKIGSAPVVSSPLWAAGFSFSAATMFIEVPYDPHLPQLFFGEESSMAARLFTHGYNFFSPTQAVVFHLWSRAHRTTLSTDQSVEDFLKDRRDALRKTSIRRVHRLLGMLNNEPTHDMERNMYSCGTVRSLASFEESIGVNFIQRSVSQTLPSAKSTNSLLTPTDIDTGEMPKTRAIDKINATRMAALSLVEQFMMKN